MLRAIRVLDGPLLNNAFSIVDEPTDEEVAAMYDARVRDKKLATKYPVAVLAKARPAMMAELRRRETNILVENLLLPLPLTTEAEALQAYQDIQAAEAAKAAEPEPGALTPEEASRMAELEEVLRQGDLQGDDDVLSDAEVEAAAELKAIESRVRERRPPAAAAKRDPRARDKARQRQVRHDATYDEAVAERAFFDAVMGATAAVRAAFGDEMAERHLREEPDDPIIRREIASRLAGDAWRYAQRNRLSLRDIMQRCCAALPAPSAAK